VAKPSGRRTTVRLEPIELSTIVQGSTTSTTEMDPIEHGAATVEMLPIELGAQDPEREDGLPVADPSKLARGSEAIAPQDKPLVPPRGPRRPRATLKVDDIAPTRPKKQS
jgi:hypothetical protein